MSAIPQALPYIPKANQIGPIIQRIISEYMGYRNFLVQNVLPETATFDNVVRGLLELSDQIQGDLAVISCLGYASPDKATRDAAHMAQSRFSGVVGDMLARDDLFRLIKAVHEDAEILEPEPKKLVKELLRDYTSAGHGTCRRHSSTSTRAEETKSTNCVVHSMKIFAQRTVAYGSPMTCLLACQRNR